MAQAQAVVLSAAVENAAISAVYTHQYSTAAAVKFVKSEVPATSYEMAVQAINQVVRPSKKFKKAK